MDMDILGLEHFEMLLVWLYLFQIDQIEIITI